MKTHLEAQENDIWKAVVNKPFVPTSVINVIVDNVFNHSLYGRDIKRMRQKVIIKLEDINTLYNCSDQKLFALSGFFLILQKMTLL